MNIKSIANVYKVLLVGFTLLTFSSYLYAESTLSFEDGEELFRTAGGYGCSTCHGMFAQGGDNVGGNIRGMSLSDINQALDNEPTMTLLSEELNLEKRELLSFYLSELGKLGIVEWIIEDKPSLTKVSIEEGKLSQLVIFNKDLEPVDLSLSPIGSETSTLINPYETKAFQWMPESGKIQLRHKQNILDIDIK